jgi:DNA-binding response OmpR family regulator
VTTRKVSPKGLSMSRVIILEDEGLCMDLFFAILACRGYDPSRARTCFEVQQHLAGNSVDALIADVFLRTQRCHGTDVALKAQSTQPAIRILFVSGLPFGDWSETDRQNVARLAGESWDTLQKPFTPATLLSHLNALLNRPSSPAPVNAGCRHNRDCEGLNPTGAGSPIGE